MPIYKMQGKKDGKQKYRVFINYTDSYGNYHKKSKIVYGSDEAKECEHRLSLEISEAAPSIKMTIGSLYKEYISVKALEMRQTSLSKTSSLLTRGVLPYFENTPLDKLNISILQKWKTEIGDKKLAVKSKNNFFKEFRALLNYAVKMEYIPRNPLASLGGFKEVYFESTEDKIQYYTAEQFKLFITAAKSHIDNFNDYGYYIFFNIAFYTGMRKGEINALKWSDIDGDFIKVRRSIAQKVKGIPIVETPPKNKSSYRTLLL